MWGTPRDLRLIARALVMAATRPAHTNGRLCVRRRTGQTFAPAMLTFWPAAACCRRITFTATSLPGAAASVSSARITCRDE